MVDPEGANNSQGDKDLAHVYRSPNLKEAVRKVLEEGMSVQEAAEGQFFSEELLEVRVREARYR